MSKFTETLVTLKELRDPGETCSQYVFGKDSYYVNEAFDHVSKSPEYVQIADGEEKLEHDIVFYMSMKWIPTHVAQLDGTGQYVSKFFKDPLVYKHGLWESPIPETDNFQYGLFFRKITS